MASPSASKHSHRKCISFLRFRAKHIELSKTYWRCVLGSEAVDKLLSAAKDQELTVNVLDLPTRQIQYGFTVRETRENSSEYLDRIRLHLLAICCANLESFFKDITLVFLLSQGHKTSTGRLSAIGVAMGSPILARASLPEPMKYAKELFGVVYGEHFLRLRKAYKYRCALVHNGGIVAPRTISELSLSPSRLHSRLGYSWAELKAALESAYEVALITDQKIGNYKLWLEEVYLELTYLKETKTLPKKAEVWAYFHDQGFPIPRKKDRESIWRRIICSA